jgi:hypothetical protein
MHSSVPPGDRPRCGRCPMMIDLHPDIAVDQLIDRLDGGVRRTLSPRSFAAPSASHPCRSRCCARSPVIEFRAIRPCSPAW